MALWSGRLPPSDRLMAQLNDSLPFDQRLGEVDIRASIAWANALGNAGIITDDETNAITTGLKQVLAELTEGNFSFEPQDEDIHTAVERRLTEIIGPVGGKLHTGRSRNDQVATDFRLWVMQASNRLTGQLRKLQNSLIERAESDFDLVMPGYTHLQQAQPILLSHWWLAHFWALDRDLERLHQVYQSAARLPLGCGALAGTAFSIDRFALARDLGFNAPMPNSLDAVGDRDFAAEFLFWAAMTGIHLSRLAEALVLFSSREFSFITLADEYSTGSSLMPQKKNPDPLELTRAKSGMLIGRLAGLLATLKGLPSAYDKDLQEDKLPVFEAADMLELLLPVLSGLLRTLTVNRARLENALDPALLATDLADYLVRRGVPFRQAHQAVGQAVRQAEASSVPLSELPLDKWQAIHPAFDNKLFQVFDVQHSIAQRAAWGGTAPSAVKAQLDLAKHMLVQTPVDSDKNESN